VDQTLELLGDHLVALAHDDVEHSLRTNDLAGGGDQRRVACILTNAGDLGQHFVQLVFLTGILQLLEHVGEHTARHLIQQGVGVHAQALGADLAVGDVLFAQLSKVSAHDVQLLQIQTGIVVGALQGSHQALGGHMAGAKAQGAHGGIDDIGTCLDALEDGHGSQTCSVVAVDIHRDADGLLQLLDQIIAGIGSEQTCHILDADGVCAHLLQSLGVGCKVLVVVHRAQGVADAALHMSAFLVGRLDGSLQVAGVVQSIEDADDVDAVGNRLLYKVLHSVICVGTVAQHILAAEQHLQLLMRQFLAQDAQTLPRILVQEADATVERSAAPALHGEVVDLVHFGQDGAHLVHGHTGSQQRLVRITQDDLGHLDRLFCHGCHLFLSSWKPERHRS
jgi:hypothetical protein